ncbi:16S rRNA (uracil(1498)-N(3))-methyltransferase [bacterium]|nr:MAG: 16S rRNA (uracil(1498)-N(3))-methyltransferase [bacterium]
MSWREFSRLSAAADLTTKPLFQMTSGLPPCYYTVGEIGGTMTVATFYIHPDRISGSNAILEGGELGHARLTLRLSSGDRVKLLDGNGTIYQAVFLSVSPHEGVLEIVSQDSEPEPELYLTMAMGIVRGERFEWAIQKACELGVSSIIPLVTERIEDKISGRWKRRGRLERVITSACKQCERARFPMLHEPLHLTDLDPHQYDLAVAFWEEETSSSTKEVMDPSMTPQSCIIVIGPVGGFTEDEARLMKKRGFLLAGMGPRILRTETAALAGVAIIQHLYGDMG